MARRLRPLLLIAAAGGLGWALVAWLTGGIDARVFGLTLRARGALRPLAAAVVLLAVYAALERRALRERLRNPARLAASLAPWLAGALALITTIDAIRYGAFVAGGSDSYGYLSEAYGWATGRLPQPYAVPLSLPFPSSDWMQTPLGWWPARAPHTIAPSYAPGLPLLMAIGILVADPLGPYLVVPLCAGLFVWAAFVLARRIAGPAAGLAAALLAATSPVVLFMSLWPMSDVPAGAMWTAAAAAAVAGSRRGAVGAGLLAALALLIRSNLAPLAAAPLAFIVLTVPPAERLRRAALYSVSVVAAAAFVAALNAAWFGSPFLSGYGNPRDLYTLDNVWPNLQRYTAWIWQSQSPWIVVSAVSVIALRRRSARRAPVALMWLMCAVTLLCYVSYERYDQWWFLRFLIPALGVFFVLIAVSLVLIAERLPRPWGAALAVVVLVLLVRHAVVYSIGQQMFGPFKASEHKYADVGAFIARQLPGDAVLFSMQHSGSIRYYGGRHTLRYDLLDPASATGAAAEIERLGLHPYLAIEDAEAKDVQRVFGLPADRKLSWPVVARLNTSGGVTIYDLATRPSLVAPMRIDPGSGPAYSAPVPVVIEPHPR